MVAMFRYSTVATYSVSLPRWKVEFSDLIEGDFLKEVEDVCISMSIATLLVHCLSHDSGNRRL